MAHGYVSFNQEALIADCDRAILVCFRDGAQLSKMAKPQNLVYAEWMTHLDPFEKKILCELQRDSTQTTAQIAEQVGLSVSPCWRRIDRLQRDGFIRKQVAILDRRKVGLNAHVFAQVKLNAHGRANLDEFSTAIQGFAEVMDAYVLMGTMDFMLRIVTEDIDAYESFFFNQLSKLPGIQEINSTVALSEIKSTTELPLRC